MDTTRMLATTFLLTASLSMTAPHPMATNEGATPLRCPVLNTREHSARGPSERESASEASGGGAPRVFENGASASASGGGDPLRRLVLDTREGDGPRASARDSLEPLRGAHAPSNSRGGGVPAAIKESGAPRAVENDDQADDLLERARDLIEQGRFERAVDDLNRVIALKTSTRTDAALYWKAYSLAKLGQQTDALRTVADLYEKFATSRWLKDAKALEVEIRQASGQPVRPESQNDDDLKLYALRGLMNSDPDQALPIIEKMLSGTDSPKVKDRALFVLSQSHSPRARDIIASAAKGGVNSDLQLKAIRYLGIMGGPENRQILADVYRSSNDTAIKRSILRSYMVAGDRERLFSLAKGETDPALRGEAVRQLGVMHAGSELSQLYQSESSVEVRKQILQAIFVGGDSDKLIELAKGEREPELRKTAIQNLGLMKRPGTTEVLTAIYASDTAPDVKKAVVNAFFLQQNASALVGLARAEKSPEMKKEIVSKLSLMKSKEATDYLLELLK